ncbi:MAG TPA: oligosaccharide flippase family protein [Candidatus Hydrogenedentes bacterium]|nr:oligosaccharide flippase family protein [Candidatus Hydrogenedentota bacterium]
MAGPEPPARPLMRLGMLWSAEAAQKVLSFLLFIALSRGLTVAENGLYGLYLSLFPLFAVAMNWGVYDILTRETACAPERSRRLLAAGLLGQTAVALPVLLAAAGAWLFLRGERTTAAFVTALAVLPLAWGRSALGVFTGHERFGAVALGQVLLRVLAVGATLAMLWAGAGVPALVGVLGPVHLLWAALMTVCAWWWFGGEDRAPSAADTRWILREGAPVMAGGFAATAYFAVDLLVLGLFLDGDALGRYALGMRFLFMLMPLTEAVGGVVFPGLSRAAREGAAASARALEDAWRLAVEVGLPLATGALLLAEPLTVFLGGDQYAGTGFPLSGLTVAAALFLPALVGQAQLRARGRQALAAVLFAGAALLKTAGAFLLSPAFGGNGLVWLNITLGAALAAVLFAVSARSLGVSARRMALGILPALGATTVMAAVVFVLRECPVLVSIGAGALVYGAAVLPFRRNR